MVLGMNNVRAQAITEGFDNITTLPAAGWFTQNNSTPVGSTGWFQGSTPFAAQGGAANSYIGANFNNTTGTNTISNWLLTPNRTFNNGDVIKFWTRTITANPFPDRLQVRFSSAGASTNVGTGSTAVGDFTTLLLDINPTYNDTPGAPPGSYPDVWTEITITLSGLSGPTSGRVAIRYFVESGGPTGDNSNYIGIDTFSYTPGAVVVTADAALDYNGDHKTDYTVVRNTGGGPGGQITWFINPGTGLTGYLWGLSTDFFVSGDFDNDGKDDVAVYRPGAATVAAFYILKSSNFTAIIEPFGQTGDDPTVVGDYNGDGQDDVAVYRGGVNAGDPSFWFYRTAFGGAVSYVPWGKSGDFEVPGDMDGDGKYDFTVQRAGAGGTGEFWTRLATGVNQPVFAFGQPSDLVVPGDYDGDGKTDICVARASGGNILWTYRSSMTGAVGGGTVFGLTTDTVAQGDYTGDGRTDFAVWRAGTFWVQNVATGATNTFGLGAPGDYPVANFNTH
ncbi:MAG: hypothetical protein DMF63_12710 [Acidobacteria bacterium]|nr:MAG: hypothetical protein DMF63_12710 [Acidobacteriota bacterium]